MKKRMIWASVMGVIFMLLVACGKTGGEGDRTVLLVSAAASLKDSMDAIATNYEKDHPDIDVQFNYGSSGTLQKQIEQGAPADLFLSAGRKQMDALAAKKLISERRDVLSNRLVLIVNSDFAGDMNVPDKLLESGVRKIAVGEPESVPAGTYARQALSALGLWDKLQTKMVFAKDVRQVLTFVETGNADAGLVYRTDVAQSDRMTLALEIPEDTHDPIVYPFGVVAATKHSKEATAFYQYLMSEPALQTFRANGFLQP